MDRTFYFIFPPRYICMTRGLEVMNSHVGLGSNWIHLLFPNNVLFPDMLISEDLCRRFSGRSLRNAPFFFQATKQPKKN